MAHAAIAYAKAHLRRRMMACTTSIGPGATNLVTAAALAHVNRLPVLFLPGDVFVSRAPDPVLQQVEDFQDGTVSANDCFRPVSRYFDRIVHPEQLLTALPRAVRVLTDAALCGPVTLALPQDVQTMAYDYPEAFFAPATIAFRAPRAVRGRARDARWRSCATRSARCSSPAAACSTASPATRCARSPRRTACRSPRRRPARARCPGTIRCSWARSASPGSPAANALAREADVVLAVGTRLQDFTTGSHSLFAQARLVNLNVNALRRAQVARRRAVRRRRRRPRRRCRALLGGWRCRSGVADRARSARARRLARRRSRASPAQRDVALPYDGDVIGAVQRSAPDSAARDIVVCAAGTLPAELHKLWRTSTPGRLSHRVRLLVHGLRDRRRPRRQDGAARARGRSSWSATAATSCSTPRSRPR